MLDLDLQGFWISDRTFVISLNCQSFMGYAELNYYLASISWDVVQEQIPAVDFVHRYENVFAFK